MTIKILAIGDIANVVTGLKRALKNTEIHIVDFPKKLSSITIKDPDTEIFDSLNVLDHIKKINQIKNRYDLVLVTGWDAARVAYLADLNYIMYFVGSDIRMPPFIKNTKTFYNQSSVKKYDFFKRGLYKKVFDNAIAYVTIFSEKYNELKKYKKDARRIDLVFFDSTIFNPNQKPVNLVKRKFTFLCPLRIGIEKGFDIIWESFPLCKSDFDVLQVDWFDESSQDLIINQQIYKNKPTQVKLIPLIKKEHIGKYYAFADAVIGSMGVDYPESVEFEAVLCGKPVISYNDPKNWYEIDGKKIASPFLPKSKNPKELANLIDKIVESKDFREKLANEESEFIKKLTDPIKVAKEWEILFETLHKKHKSISKNSSYLSIKSRFIYLVLSKMFR